MNDKIVYNPEKFKAVFSYIVSRCENKYNAGKTVLCKLLYFSDFNFYEIYEKPITNETYIKFDKGPLPDHFLDVEKEMINSGDLIKEKKIYPKHAMYKYSLNKSPDLSLLSTKELAVINDVVDKLGDMSASEISEYSHGDTPWRIAKDQQPLDYEYVFYRDEEYSVRVYDEDL